MAKRGSRRRTSSRKRTCANPNSYVGRTLTFTDLKTGRRVSAKVNSVKSYSLAKGYNRNRMKGYRSYIAKSTRNATGRTLWRTIGICKVRGSSRRSRSRSRH